MKKLPIIIFAWLFIGLPSWAGMLHLPSVSDVQAGVVIAPASGGGGGGAFEGDVLNETFDSSGYDDANWTESGTMDEDSTDTPPIGQTGFATQCLKYTGAWTQAYSIWDDTTDRNIIYFRTRLYVETEALSDGDDRGLITMYDDGSIYRVGIRLIKSGTQLQVGIEDDDAAVTDTTNISEDTSYELEVRWDNTNDVLEFRVDGVQQYINNSWTPGSGDEPFSHFHMGWKTGAEDTTTIYYDDVDIDTSGYPTD